jgi:hypothetical protein
MAGDAGGRRGAGGVHPAASARSIAANGAIISPSASAAARREAARLDRA